MHPKAKTAGRMMTSRTGGPERQERSEHVQYNAARLYSESRSKDLNCGIHRCQIVILWISQGAQTKDWLGYDGGGAQ